MSDYCLEDQELIKRLEEGEKITSISQAGKTYRKLVSGLLLQFADSELAASASYAESVKLGPTLDERIDVATIARDKMLTGKRTYELLSQFGINLDKYFACHTWEAKVSRYTDLGYSRASSDKRLNALLYPLEGWADLSVFTYLMATMSVVQLEDFLDSSYQPWSQLCGDFLVQEKAHRDMALNFITRLLDNQSCRLSVQSSLEYWYQRVAHSFGPHDSEGNKQFRAFLLKSRKNQEARVIWNETIKRQLEELGLASGCYLQSIGT
ncbi:MAG: phenylacetate-CoA oxygenase subunit PaaI [Candidatus Obscuribacterales bacterium]|nr:phenylacetate-CoA oxygenase subunit PaaI [Candidatus Obscuribacterales bacterium]